jgi:hypothetical protein
MLLLGEDRSASRALSHVGGEARRTEGLLSHMSKVGGSALGSLGKIKPVSMVAGLGIAGGAAAITGFGKSSVTAFQATAAAARSTQRVLGGSLEDASRLNFSAGQVGISSDQMTLAMGRLEKQMASKTSPALTKLGINFKDANGLIKPMAAVLPQIEDKFAKMANGPQKTAFALQLFGKAGAGLLPFLNKGAKGVAELGKESDKLGLTMGSKSIKSIGDNRKAHRELEDAMKGLKVTVGAVLMPIMTKLFTFFTSYAVPAIDKLSRWFSDKLVPVLKRDLPPILARLSAIFKNDIVPVVKTVGTVFANVFGFFARHISTAKTLAVVLGTIAGVIGTLLVVARVITTVTKAWTAVQAALNIVMSLNPVALVVFAIVALIAIIVVIATKTTWFQTIWKTVWGAIHGAIMFVWNWIRSHWPLLLAILTGPIGIAVLFITRHWKSIKDGATAVISWIVNKFNSLVGFFTSLPGKIAHVASGLFNSVKDGATIAVKWVGTKIGSLVGFFTGLPGKIAAKVGNLFVGIKNAFKSAINGIIGIWNGLHFKIPGFSVLGHKFGGADIGLPQLPKLATGGQMFDGLTTVGENGPELMAKSGSRVDVLSNAQSRSYLSRAAKTPGDTYVFNVQSLDPAGAGRAVAAALERHVGTGGTVRMASGLR